MRHVCISPLFFLTLLFAWQMEYLSVFLITYSCLLFHEGIHLFFLCKHKIPVRQIRVEPFGISIQTDQKTPENAIIYLSAPIGNLLVAGALSLAYYQLTF